MNPRPVHLVLVLIALAVWGGVFVRYVHLKAPPEDAPQTLRRPPPGQASDTFVFRGGYPDPFHYGFPPPSRAAAGSSSDPSGAPGGRSAAAPSMPAPGGFLPPVFPDPALAPAPPPERILRLVGVIGERALVGLGQDRVVLVRVGEWVDGLRVERIEHARVVLRPERGAAVVLTLP